SRPGARSTPTPSGPPGRAGRHRPWSSQRVLGKVADGPLEPGAFEVESGAEVSVRWGLRGAVLEDVSEAALPALLRADLGFGGTASPAGLAGDRRGVVRQHPPRSEAAGVVTHTGRGFTEHQGGAHLHLAGSRRESCFELVQPFDVDHRDVTSATWRRRAVAN